MKKEDEDKKQAHADAIHAVFGSLSSFLRSGEILVGEIAALIDDGTLRRSEKDRLDQIFARLREEDVIPIYALTGVVQCVQRLADLCRAQKLEIERLRTGASPKPEPIATSKIEE